ncbi:MAG: FHA domain-containing protein [Verrucomicrobia bacterium]|jgi:hypothetical protein|nr:FHA domain-containing protein [Verrucomicrobiota bacterium]
MARLIIHIDGAPDRVRELEDKPYLVGRGPENDIVLAHPSVSTRHCLIELREEGLLVRDLGSTNGTELDGRPILEAFAQSGQVLRIGSVECRVEGVSPRVSIPVWQPPAPPELAPGEKPCVNHPERPASMECSHCHRLFCGPCIHLMQRQGGVLHKLCPVCSHPCIPMKGMNEAGTPGRLAKFLGRIIPKTGTMRILGRGERR